MTSRLSEKPWRNTSRSDCYENKRICSSFRGKSNFSLKNVQFIPGVRSDGHAAAPLQELPEVPLCWFLQEAG